MVISTMDSKPSSEEDFSSYSIEYQISIYSKKAYEHFASKRYGECIKVLHELLKKKENDLKVMHNLALAEFYHEGCIHPQKFMQTLSNIEQQIYESNGLSKNIHSNSNSNKTKTSSLLPFSGILNLSKHFSEMKISNQEHIDLSIVTVNKAILSIILHDYDTASLKLSSVLNNIQQFNEFAALSIYFSLLDFFLHFGEIKTSVEIYNKMSKYFGYDFDKSISRKYSSLESKSSKAFNEINESQSQSQSQTMNPIACMFDSLAMDEIMEKNSTDNINLSLSMDINANQQKQEKGKGEEGREGRERGEVEGKGEGKMLSSTLILTAASPSPSPSSSSSSSNQLSQSALIASFSLLRFFISYYRARIHLSLKNVDLAEACIKSLIENFGENIHVLFLKSHTQMEQNNFESSIQTLKQCLLLFPSDRNSPFLSSLFYNMAVLHQKMNKPKLSSFYFMKSMQLYSPSPLPSSSSFSPSFSTSSLPSSSIPLPSPSLSNNANSNSKLLGFFQRRFVSIMYNAGVNAVFLGNFSTAFDLFQSCLPLLSNNVLLWTRMGECCILMNEKRMLLKSREEEGVEGNEEKESDSIKKDCDVFLKVVGEGKWKRVLLHRVDKNRDFHSERKEEEEEEEEEGKKKERKSRSVLDEVEDMMNHKDGNAVLFLNKKIKEKEKEEDAPTMEYAYACITNAIYLLKNQFDFDKFVFKDEDDKVKDKEVKGEEMDGKEEEKEKGGKGVKSEEEKENMTKEKETEKEKEEKGKVVKEKEKERNEKLPLSLMEEARAYEEKTNYNFVLLWQCLLTNAAFIELRLGKIHGCSKTMEEFFKIKTPSLHYSYLAHMYMAEALVRMHKPSEAFEKLSSFLFTNLNSLSEPKQSEKEEANVQRSAMDSTVIDKPLYKPVNKPDSGLDSEQSAEVGSVWLDLSQISSLYVNLASESVVGGDLVHARTFTLRALTFDPKNKEAIMMSAFLALKNGNFQEALSMIKLGTNFCLIKSSSS